MKAYHYLFRSMPLFAEIKKEKYVNVLSCLQANIVTYTKDDIIYNVTDDIDKAGIVLDGKVNLSFYSDCGVEHSIRQFEKGEIFGETYACMFNKQHNAQVTATTDSKILFLRISQLFTDVAKACPLASQVTVNLLKEIAAENVFLNQKVELLAQKKIRDKIKVYLKSINSDESNIKLSFTRQEMANYLAVDRSALSRELGVMRNEGLIYFNKHFITVVDKSFLL